MSRPATSAGIAESVTPEDCLAVRDLAATWRLYVDGAIGYGPVSQVVALAIERIRELEAQVGATR